MEVAPGSPGAQRGIKRGDLLLAVNGEPVETPGDVLEYPAPGPRGHAPLVHARPAGIAAGARRLARAGEPPDVDVLRARGGRALHAARRRLGPAAPAARSGDAAFLLAVRRLLRRVHVLVQRSVRSARLDVLLGRRGGDGAAAAAAPALHAGVPGAAAVACIAAERAAAAGDVPAGARARRGAHRRRSRAGRVRRRRVFAGARPARSRRAGLPVPVRAGGGRRPGARVRRDHVADRRAASFAGLRGGRCSASVRSRSATRCRGRSASIRRSRFS